jgi:hypothetical protein
MKSVNLGGVSAAGSNAVSGRPYVGGSAPTIVSAKASTSSATLIITAGSGAYPAIVGYEYSLDGVLYQTVAVSPEGVIVINGLATNTAYMIRVRGYNSEGVRSENAMVSLNTESAARFYGMFMTPVGAAKIPIFIGAQPKPSKLGTSTNDSTETKSERRARYASGRKWR